MRIACNVIDDLYPLYKDDVCSGESRALVEAHLHECEECRKKFEDVDVEIQSEPIGLDEKRQITELAKKWEMLLKKRAIRAVIKTIAVMVVLLLILDFATAGKTKNAKMTIDKSDRLTEAEMDDALDALLDYFHDKRGSELISVSYDEEYSDRWKVDALHVIDNYGGNWDGERYIIVSTSYNDPYNDVNGPYVEWWKYVIYYDTGKQEWVVLSSGAG